jgi:GGDEF domain-containing protein
VFLFESLFGQGPTHLGRPTFGHETARGFALAAQGRTRAMFRDAADPGAAAGTAKARFDSLRSLDDLGAGGAHEGAAQQRSRVRSQWILGGVVDKVTGFGSREAMVAALEHAVVPGAPYSVLAVFVLDGLPEFAKQQAAEASNEMITRLAQEFERFIGPDGECYAPRRHEFAVLFTLPFMQVERILAAAAIAVRREGAIFEISTSFGYTHLPGEARSPIQALIVADKRRLTAQRLRG